jgi:hypothetical protein
VVSEFEMLRHFFSGTFVLKKLLETAKQKKYNLILRKSFYAYENKKKEFDLKCCSYLVQCKVQRTIFAF